MSIAALRVLVVEDRDDVAASLQAALQALGHLTRIACSVTEAVNATKEFDPQLVFLDIGLPDGNGYSFARTIRQRIDRRQPFIAALTGLEQYRDQREAHAAGCNCHMVKPLSTTNLQTVLDAAAVHARLA